MSGRNWRGYASRHGCNHGARQFARVGVLTAAGLWPRVPHAVLAQPAPAQPVAPVGDAPQAPPASEAPAAPAPVLAEPPPSSPAPQEPPATPPASSPSLVPPRVVRSKPPVYPVSHLTHGEHPTVVLKATILADGSVADVSVEHTAGEDFDQAAIEALRRWSFEPASRDGVAIASRVGVAVHFELPELGAFEVASVSRPNRWCPIRMGSWPRTRKSRRQSSAPTPTWSLLA